MIFLNWPKGEPSDGVFCIISEISVYYFFYIIIFHRFLMGLANLFILTFRIIFSIPFWNYSLYCYNLFYSFLELFFILLQSFLFLSGIILYIVTIFYNILSP